MYYLSVCSEFNHNEGTVFVGGQPKTTTMIATDNSVILKVCQAKQVQIY